MKAIFLGGAFHLTERQVNAEVEKITFFEPLHFKDAKAYQIPIEYVVCRVLLYRLINKTQLGFLIYEYEGIIE